MNLKSIALEIIKNHKPKKLLLEYYDDIVKEFYGHSLNGTMTDFDFQEAFDEMIGPLRRKLAEHGLLDYETFAEQMSEIYYESREAFKSFNIETNYIQIDGDEIADVVWKYVHGKFRETFGNMSQFEDLTELYDEIQNANYEDTEAMTILFDKLIHAQHVSGDIYDDIDIEDLRQEVEDEWEEEQKKKKMNTSRIGKWRKGEFD